MAEDKNNDDDDLLSDFNDLFPDEGDDSGDDVDDLLGSFDDADSDDDLDSLLDGLEQQMDSGEDSGADLTESAEKKPENSASFDADSDDEDDLLDSLLESNIDDSEGDSSEDDDLLASLMGDDDDDRGVTDNSALDIDSDDLDLSSGLDDFDEPEESMDDLFAESPTESEADSSLDNSEDDALDDLFAEADDDTVADSDDDPLDDLFAESSSDADSGEEDLLDELIADDQGGDEASDIENELIDTDVEDKIDLADVAVPAAAAAVAATAAVVSPKKEVKEELEVEDYVPQRTRERKESKKTSSSSGNFPVIMTVLVLIGIGLSGGALWMAMGASQAVVQADGKLNEIKQQIDTTANRDPRVNNIRQGILDLTDQVNEMAKALESRPDPIAEEVGEHHHSDQVELIESVRDQLKQLDRAVLAVENQQAELSRQLQKQMAMAPVTAPASSIPAAPMTSTSSADEWVINLLSLSSNANLDETMKRLSDAGINATSKRVQSNGKEWIRVQVGGFKNREEAQAFARNLPKVQGINSNWVSR